MFLSNLDSGHHKLLIIYGLIRLIPSFRGWEAFPPSGLGTSSTLRLLGPSHQRHHKCCVSSLCPWCCGHSSWRGVRHLRPTRQGVTENKEPQGQKHEQRVLFQMKSCLKGLCCKHKEQAFNLFMVVRFYDLIDMTTTFGV